MLKRLLVPLVAIFTIAAVEAATGPSEDDDDANPAASEPGEHPDAPEPDAPPTPATLEELAALVVQQRELLAEQQQRIEAQQQQIEEMSALLLSVHRRLDEVDDQPPDTTVSEALERRIQAIEEATQTLPELEQEVSGDFPGALRIPGTDAAIRIGGRVQLSLVHSLDALGSDDRFLTHSIPVDIDVDSGDAARLNIHARASRLNFDFRTPSGVGYVRAFIEGDFDEGARRAFRLRHAYGQFGRYLTGQTWSTFSDPEADPEDIDFEGLNSLNTLRTAQFRATWQPRAKLSIGLGVENASASITGGASVNQIPDFIGRATFRGDFGHVQLAGVTRQIRGDPVDASNDVIGKAGGGGALSGKLHLPFLHENDTLAFSLSGGHGVARYITDLSSLGGHDGVFNPETGDLEVYPAIAWYIGLQHFWNHARGLRSSLVWGHVDVSNFAFEPDEAYDRTERLSLNLLWSPTRRLDVGLEYIYGLRVNKDGARGHANQIQMMSRFAF